MPVRRVAEPVLYAYCMRRAGELAPPAGLAGVGEGAVRLVERGALGVWISEVAEVRATLDAVRAHDRVVSTALRSATPLPIRFGARFADRAALEAMLAGREGELLAALERVAGRVEMGLALVWAEPPAEAAPEPQAAPSSGREYLERRQRARRAGARRRERADALAHAAEELLCLGDAPALRTLCPAPEVAARLAHLVRREELAGYRARAAELSRELPEVVPHVTGPWAPYSFVRSDDAAHAG
jgi:hypothetical protein